MRFRGLIICGLLGVMAAQGCEQRIPKSDLGQVIFELPNVPGGDKRPATPEVNDLTPPKEEQPAAK
jgi:hypothetical protein